MRFTVFGIFGGHGAFMAIMENHLKQLKPNLLKISVNSQIAGYVYYKEESTKIIARCFRSR